MPHFGNQEGFGIIYDIDSIGKSIQWNIEFSWIHGDESDLMVRIGCVHRLSCTVLVLADEDGVFVAIFNHWIFYIF